MPMAEISGARRGAPRQRAVGHALQRPAVHRGERHRQDEHQQQHQGHERHPRQAEQQEGDDGDERPQHVDLAVGEVDHADDAVHHRVADGDEAVDRPQGQAVDQLLGKVGHELCGGSGLWTEVNVRETRAPILQQKQSGSKQVYSRVGDIMQTAPTPDWKYSEPDVGRSSESVFRTFHRVCSSYNVNLESWHRATNPDRNRGEIPA